VIDSDNFNIVNGHKNPSEMIFKSKSEMAETVTFGRFVLAKTQKHLIKN
jgi:hypothetical protein